MYVGHERERVRTAIRYVIHAAYLLHTHS